MSGFTFGALPRMSLLPSVQVSSEYCFLFGELSELLSHDGCVKKIEILLFVFFL